MATVSNTGPLIALAEVDGLTLLKDLFEEILIPPAVHRELLAKTGPESHSLDDALSEYVHVTPTPEPAPEIEVVTQDLGPGEQQAIVLAHSLGALLLMDERLGRAAARRLGVRVTGVVGVLVRAKEVGFIPKVRPVLEEIRQEGYWLSDTLLDAAAKLARE